MILTVFPPVHLFCRFRLTYSLVGDKLKPSKIKLRTRQEDECHRTHATRNLKAEELLMASLPRELRNLRDFVTSIVLNTYCDRVMRQLGTATDVQCHIPTVTEVHSFKYKGYVVADPYNAAATAREAVAVNVISFSSLQRHIASGLPGK